MIFIISGYLAVICMTAFSALWSQISNNQFREPTLLTLVFEKTDMLKSNKTRYIVAWILHFILGYLFLGVYEILWWFLDIDRTLFWSLIFGFISGLLGVSGWAILFKISKFNSRFPYMHYYIHLLLAHIIFSMVIFLVYTEYYGMN